MTIKVTTIVFYRLLEAATFTITISIIPKSEPSKIRYKWNHLRESLLRFAMPGKDEKKPNMFSFSTKVKRITKSPPKLT